MILSVSVLLDGRSNLLDVPVVSSFPTVFLVEMLLVGQKMASAAIRSSIYLQAILAISTDQHFVDVALPVDHTPSLPALR